jgi:hypothetical protein
MACSLQHVEKVQEHMSLAETFRIGLDLEEPLASRVAVLSITVSHRPNSWKKLFQQLDKH